MRGDENFGPRWLLTPHALAWIAGKDWSVMVDAEGSLLNSLQGFRVDDLSDGNQLLLRPEEQLDSSIPRRRPAYATITSRYFQSFC